MTPPFHLVAFGAEVSQCLWWRDEPHEIRLAVATHGNLYRAEGNPLQPCSMEVVCRRGPLVEDPCPHCGRRGYRRYEQELR